LDGEFDVVLLFQIPHKRRIFNFAEEVASRVLDGDPTKRSDTTK